MLLTKSSGTLAKVLGLLVCCASAAGFNTYGPGSCLQRSFSRPAWMPRGSLSLPQTRLFQAGTSNLDTDGSRLLTMEEVEECARAFDIELRLSTLGPFYRVVAKNTRDGEAVGYSSGFVVPPLQVIHLDTMQVRQKYWKTLDGPQKFRYGCGVLLGAAVMCHAKSQGCSKAELLAINDDEKTHNRLKAFYALAGFRAVKEVTSELQHLPDLLVWGGIGTRMDAQVDAFLRKWAPLIRSRGEQFMAQP